MNVIRILLIETLLFGLLGAVVFRLLFAFIRRLGIVWLLSLVAALGVSFTVSGSLDPRLLREWGSASASVSPLLIRALRALAWLAGAVLAQFAVARRARLGLEPPPDLPPGDV
ncbi:hypothetical protein [Thiomonas sp. FB-Cd]|uniref:hypothetical protein n=1 Tax=Thiomonas sp. FB-Cd TaxID=1158292 RepID=UPI00068CEA34|nr:hypothetical protein [Thiomonas sp. FB-Cd]